MAVEVSHGRGGAGNINVDDTEYADGKVVRAGIEGSHGDGAYSSGRGGAGNIADVGTAPGPRADRDIIPVAAYRPSHEHQDFHIGRGGAGNEHTASDHEKKAAATAAAKTNPDGAPISLVDRLKQRVFGIFKR